MNVWVPVADETGVVTRMLAGGWALAAGARFRVETGPGVRLTVSQVAPSEIAGLADSLASAVRPGTPGVRYD